MDPFGARAIPLALEGRGLPRSGSVHTVGDRCRLLRESASKNDGTGESVHGGKRRDVGGRFRGQAMSGRLPESLHGGLM